MINFSLNWMLIDWHCIVCVRKIFPGPINYFRRCVGTGNTINYKTSSIIRETFELSIAFVVSQARPLLDKLILLLL